jgi:hypothetical protein
MNAGSATRAEKRFARRRKVIGRLPSGRNVICCTGIATWLFFRSNVIGAHRTHRNRRRRGDASETRNR